MSWCDQEIRDTYTCNYKTLLTEIAAEMNKCEDIYVYIQEELIIL